MCSRAVSIAHSVAVDAVSCMTPVNEGGRPVISPSHCIIRPSSSVAAGDVAQLMHCAPIVAVSISARMEGGLLFAGKYPKNDGCCQCVIPGTIAFLKSANIAANGSPSGGGWRGICRVISPGAAVGLTGKRSTSRR